MALTYDAMLASVMALIRVGDAARQAYIDKLARKDIKILMPTLQALDEDKIFAKKTQNFFDFYKHKYVPESAIYHPLIVNPDSVNPSVKAENVLAANEIPLSRDMDEFIRNEVSWKTPQEDLELEPLKDEGGQQILDDKNQPMDRLPRIAIATFKDWENERESGFGRVARTLVSGFVDVASAQPGIVGLDDDAQKILVGMRPAIDRFIRVGADRNDPEQESLLSVFFNSALKTAAKHPGLITDDKKLEPLVAGILVPLQEFVEKDEGLAFFARGKLSEFFQGPLAHSLLNVLNDHPDLYLKGAFSKQKLIGAAVRATIGDFAATEASAFRLSAVVSEAGAVKFLDGLLTTIEKQPDFIVKGKGDTSESLRKFIQQSAGHLSKAPFPYNWDGGLATDIMGAALDAAADIATARIRSQLGDPIDGHEWNDVWSTVAESLIQGFVEGLRSGTADGDLSPFDLKNAWSSLFTREEAIGILKSVATAIASQPTLLLGKNDKKITRNARLLTQEIATLIASDQKQLLRGEDWLEIVAASLALLAESPVIFYSVSAEDDESASASQDKPERQIGMALISSLLSTASAQMTIATSTPSRSNGRFLFGSTLRSALLATLEAARETVIEALSQNDREDRLAAFEQFSKQLVTFIQGQDVTLGSGNDVVKIEMRLGAKDWLRAYKFFIAHVLQYGLADPIGDDDIVRLFHELEPGIEIKIVEKPEEDAG